MLTSMWRLTLNVSHTVLVGYVWYLATYVVFLIQPDSLFFICRTSEIHYSQKQVDINGINAQAAFSATLRWKVIIEGQSSIKKFLSKKCLQLNPFN